jgi:hypothetical protein
VRTYNVVDPAAPGGERTRVLGTLYAPRRQPTPDEVKRINDSLATMERGMDAPSPTASAQAKPSPPRPKAEAQGAADLPGL